MAVTGQSLWARRSCFSWATSFRSRVTSLFRKGDTKEQLIQQSLIQHEDKHVTHVKLFFSQKQKKKEKKKGDMKSLLGCSIYLYPKTKSEELKLARNLNQVKKTSLNNSLLYISQSVA